VSIPVSPNRINRLCFIDGKFGELIVGQVKISLLINPDPSLGRFNMRRFDVGES